MKLETARSSALNQKDAIIRQRNNSGTVSRETTRMDVSRETNQRYFPMQKRENISPNKSSAVNSPVMPASASCARRNSSAHNSI